jgi:hypothetical protein
LKLTLLYFMPGWSVQILVAFGVEGGEDNMPPFLWQVLHVVVRVLEVFVKGLHLPLVWIFLVFSLVPFFKVFLCLSFWDNIVGFLVNNNFVTWYNYHQWAKTITLFVLWFFFFHFLFEFNSYF